jgi:hypothetical protein
MIFIHMQMFSMVIGRDILHPELQLKDLSEISEDGYNL